MKRVIISAFMMLAAVSLSAQKKGDFYLSGFLNVSGGSNVTKVTAGNSTVTEKVPMDVEFTIAPKAGYFITDRLEVNMSVGYSLDKSRNSGSGDDVRWTRVNQFIFGPGVNYHIPLGGKFTYAPGAEILFGVGGANSDISGTTKENLGTVFSFGLRLDLLSFEFRPTDHLGIMFRAGALSYDLLQLTNKGDAGKYKTAQNNVSFGLNYSTAIGFKYYF